MHVLILTVGTRGDVQPYVALGLGLQQAGHDVTVCAPTNFQAFVESYGLTSAALRADFLRLMETAEGRAALELGGNPFSLLRKVMPMLRNILDDGYAAAEGIDAVVYHPKALAGPHIAEKLNVPGFLAMPTPLFSPTAAFASPILPFAHLGARLNRLSHHVVTRLASAPYQRMINDWRRTRLGLAPRSIRDSEVVWNGVPVRRLYGYSQLVVPTPSDWDDYSVATGYWFLPEPANWQPSDELLRFLDAGEPPIYIGFGSMAGRDTERLSRIVREAVEHTGRRALVSRGWGGLTGTHLPPSTLAIDEAPHSWLLPRTSAVVHHGGAGTTAAALLAGRPQVICPFFGDQPFWARRIHAIGCGHCPLPQKRLTADALAAAIDEVVTNTTLQRRASDLGVLLAAEDGVGQAISLITGTPSDASQPGHAVAFGKRVIA